MDMSSTLTYSLTNSSDKCIDYKLTQIPKATTRLTLKMTADVDEDLRIDLELDVYLHNSLTYSVTDPPHGLTYLTKKLTYSPTRENDKVARTLPYDQGAL